MIRRLWIAVLAPILAVVITLPGPTAVASQDESPPLYPIICAEGELVPDPPQVTRRGNAVSVKITITGWVAACAGTNPDDIAHARLAWARYNPSKTAGAAWYEPFPAGYEPVE